MKITRKRFGTTNLLPGGNADEKHTIMECINLLKVFLAPRTVGGWESLLLSEHATDFVEWYIAFVIYRKGRARSLNEKWARDFLTFKFTFLGSGRANTTERHSTDLFCFQRLQWHFILSRFKIYKFALITFCAPHKQWTNNWMNGLWEAVEIFRGAASTVTNSIPP